MNTVPMVFYRVCYTNKEVENTLRDLETPFDNILKCKNLVKDFDGIWEKIAACATSILLELLYLYKDAQYATEHEVRVITAARLTNKNVKVDERTPGHLYYETAPFLFTTNGTEIIVGPKVEKSEAHIWNIRYRLTKWNYSKNTVVKKSKVPYR